MLRTMRWLAGGVLTIALTDISAHAQTSEVPEALRQALALPFASNLTAAPAKDLFAWTEDREGVHNVWVASPTETARQLTQYTEDDGQLVRELAWAPDASVIAYTYGAPSGADGRAANPAHLQRPVALTVMVQPVAGGAVQVVGEGHAPLFSRDGKTLFYVREGNIWAADLTAKLPCHPEEPQRSEGDEGSASRVTGKVCTHRLVYDRGAASSLTLSPDGKLLAFVSRRKEAGEPSHSFLAVYDLATRALSFVAPSTGNDSAPAFAPDGRHIAWLRAPFVDPLEYANPRTSAVPWSIQLADVAAEGAIANARAIYSPEPNRPGSLLPHIDDSEPYLLWTAAPPSTSSVCHPEERSDEGSACRSSRLLFYSEADGWTHLYSIDPLHPGTTTLLTPGQYEVQDATVDATGTRLLFSANGPDHIRPSVFGYGSAAATMHDQPSPWFLDAKPLWAMDLNAHEAKAYSVRQIAAAEVHAVFEADSSAVVLYSDWQTSSRPQSMGTKPQRGDGVVQEIYTGHEHTLERALAPERVSLRSSDGITLHAFVLTPREKQIPSGNDKPEKQGQRQKQEPVKHPAILFLHGGPMRQMLAGFPPMEYYSRAYAFNQYLASRGFVVLTLNYRCGTGYGLEFRACQNAGPNGGAEYEDVVAAAKYLASRPDVDPRRIGLWGGSYGGYLTAMGLARNPELFAAGVDLHGVHDWNLEDNAGDWKAGSNAEQDAAGAKALAASPMADLSKWRAPVLLIHGDNDANVAYAQTPRLAEALRARNTTLPKEQQVEVEEIVFPDELHEFLLHKDWLTAYAAAAAFFERHLMQR